jgi:hypothetical protein
MLSPDLWREFAFDPRDPAYADVRLVVRSWTNGRTR